jgi:hypothetical protein
VTCDAVATRGDVRVASPAIQNVLDHYKQGLVDIPHQFQQQMRDQQNLNYQGMMLPYTTTGTTAQTYTASNLLAKP